ncbi:MAG: tetratricopeptide repeat protein [Coriobacteriia bacterium]|nr:tetratricopeptide repeat protein [Coriobacteriia bacterium]
MVSDGSSISKDLTPEQFQRFRDYIHQHSGIYLEESKADSLRISLITRATRYGFAVLDDYFKLLTTDETEFRELMNLVTINETSFFRFPAQFEALRKYIVPEIVEGKPETSRSFRVWSAGCSTGEEPYSVAMTLLDSGLEGLGYVSEVLGTDVSTSALERAKAAVYPSRSLLNIPHSVTTRFFEPTPEGHRVSERVRKTVDFQYHNLVKEPYPLGLMGNWDIVFCRNVTIYFRLESTRRVVENFFNSLNPGGYLFVGHSETLTSVSDKFEPVEVGGVFLYRKPRARSAPHREVMKERVTPAATSPRASATARAGSRAGRRETSSTPDPTVVENHAVDVELLVSSARRASEEGRSDDVLTLVDEILTEDESNAEAYLLAAYSHADSGDLQTALKECKRSIELDPLSAASHYVLGIIYQRQGESDRAMHEFKRTIYLDADFVLAHFNMANLQRSVGAKAEACRAYENALRSLYRVPDGEWSWFLGGFRPDLLAQTCERSLIECRKKA